MLAFAPLVVLALQQASPSTAAAEDPLAGFLKQVNEAAELLKPVKSGFGAAMNEGRVSEFVSQLLAAIPREGRPAAYDFAIASLVYDLDPATSMGLHRSVHERLPGNPLVEFEWALELHRAGRIEEAEAVYAHLPLGKPTSPAAVRALHAETLARLGRYHDAVETWKQIDLEADRDTVEQALSWVHAPLSPWARRAALIARVSQGDDAAPRDLLHLDLNFDTSPLRSQVRGDLVQADLARIRAAPHADASLVATLEAFTRLGLASAAAEEAVKKEEDIEPARAQAMEAARAAHLLGETASLPADSRLAAEGLIHLVGLDLATPPEVLAGFGDELWSRARGPAGDADAAGLLADLYAGIDSERADEALHLGWERARDADCACRLLFEIETLKHDDPLLAEALKQHPDDAHLLSCAVTGWVNESAAPPASLVARMLVASTTQLLDVELIDSTYGLFELADAKR